MRQTCNAPGRKRWLTASLFQLQHFHLAARRDPRVQPTLQRPHTQVAPVHQQAGDTRRAGFIRSTAVDDHVTVAGEHRGFLISRCNVDQDGSGDTSRIKASCGE